LKLIHNASHFSFFTFSKGTSKLGSLRFGLNSGPTTAGVLRGEKGRFQLFGDTVNTAARMESNGDTDRIHISQSTVDLLIADGKAHWLTPREMAIHAKGTGIMQTYWCEPTLGKQVRGGSIGGSSMLSANSSIDNSVHPDTTDNHSDVGEKFKTEQEEDDDDHE
jgi:hypothetical protein